MMKKLLLKFFFAAFLLQGCVEYTVSGVHESNFLGRYIDQVTSKLKLKGFTCGSKYKDKVINASEIFGQVVCTKKEVALVCPDSHLLYVSFDLESNIVKRLTKKTQTNCF